MRADSGEVSGLTVFFFFLSTCWRSPGCSRGLHWPGELRDLARSEVILAAMPGLSPCPTGGQGMMNCKKHPCEKKPSQPRPWRGRQRRGAGRAAMASASLPVPTSAEVPTQGAPSLPRCGGQPTLQTQLLGSGQWGSGGAACPGARSPAVLIDDDCLAVLVA